MCNGDNRAKPRRAASVIHKEGLAGLQPRAVLHKQACSPVLPKYEEEVASI